MIVERGRAWAQICRRSHPSAPTPMKSPRPQTAHAVPHRAGTRFAGTVLSLALGVSLEYVHAAEVPQPGDTAKEPGAKLLSVFEVREDKDEGYRTSQTTSGFSSLTTIRNTPGSISVLNRELMDDLNVVSVAELSKYAVTGEVGTATEGQSGTMSGGGAHVFRGVVGNIQLRNGAQWQIPVDSYNLDRVEILRGPSAFLYGEGAAGGMMNQVTKQAQFQDFRKVALYFGSYNFQRVEFDYNRRLSDKFAIRSVIGLHQQDSYRHHADRDFKAVYFSVAYRPFKTTNVKFDAEHQRNSSTTLGAIQSDAYSTTDRTGTSTLLTATTGGSTFVPALGQVYDTVGLRRGSGTNLVIPFLTGESVLRRADNYSGPDTYFNFQVKAISLNADQRIGENLNALLRMSVSDTHRQLRGRGGSSSAQIVRDLNPTLPSGAVNPYFNQLYTEYYFQEIKSNEPKVSIKAAAVYDVKLPFMTQRVLVRGSYDTGNPSPNDLFTEVVDPAGPRWKGGVFNPASTRVDYNANNTILAQNYLYRRLYLRDGDGANLTGAVPAPGAKYIRSAVDGTGGRLSNRIFRIRSYGGGIAGTYWKERIHTVVGWRRDAVEQNTARDFFNYTTQQYFFDPTLVRVSTDFANFRQNTADSLNYGAVASIFPFVSAYYNYAQSVAISSGIGAGTKLDNTLRGVPTGDGNEYGLRWIFLGGKIESNWTRYTTKVLRQSVTPTLQVREELFALFPEINQAGSDTQATKAGGYEFETTANLSKNWRLTWNYASNTLETSDRYELTKGYREAAKAKNQPTPEADAFLLTVPEGTPVTGYTKVRSNLVTNYRFDRGPLKGVSVGGGAQYRKPTYLGNFDLNRDGVAEMLWTPSYTLANFSVGYRTQIWKRKTDFGLVVSNILGKRYYRALALGSGAWGEPRDLRLSVRIDL